MQESKSTGTAIQGRHSELLVRRKFLQQGYKLLSQNLRYSGVETDLLFMWKQSHLTLVEVKSLRHIDEAGFRLKPQQKYRLRLAAERIEELFDKPVEIRAVFVLPQGDLLDLDLSDIS